MSASTTNELSTDDSAMSASEPSGLSNEDALVMRAEQLRLRRRWWWIFAGRISVFVSFFASWEFFSGDPGVGLAIIDEFYVSKPSNIVDAILGWLEDGSLIYHSAVTAKEMILGFIVGAVLALVVGFTLGVSQTVSKIIGPFITAAYSIPRLALVPLFILWFGLGLGSKVVYVSTVVFFLVFYNTYSGVRDVDEEVTDVLRLMGARLYQVYAKATLPSAMTWIIAGLRISVPYALVAAVTAEILASNEGLGYLLIKSSNQFYIGGVFGSILIMVLLGLAMNGLMSLVERRLLAWKR